VRTSGSPGQSPAISWFRHETDQGREAANTVVAALTAEAIDAIRHDQLNLRTGEASGVPASGVNGPLWEVKNVAPIRLVVGSKP
jgi:hypothetical protein